MGIEATVRVTEAAKYLPWSETQIRDRLKDHRIRGVKAGGSQWLIPLEEILRLQKELGVESQ